MTTLDIRPDLEGSPWTDLEGMPHEHAEIERVGLLANATDDGEPAVVLLLKTEYGRPIVAHTTLKLARQAVAILRRAPLCTQVADRGWLS